MSVSLPLLPPLSLYVHIPWCVRKCPYCDFNSHESEVIPETAYVKALSDDLAADLKHVQGRKFTSIFFGGGTPSLFSAQSIAAIVDDAKQKVGFEEEIEITLEANPGTFEQEKFNDFFHAGINRLSIGIQSFQAHHLRRLGRIHSDEEAVQAVRMAQQAGFNNINLDLMHGLPEQTPDQALADLQQAITLKPQHISWYQLTIEPNTVFYHQPPHLPVDDVLADIQDNGQALLDVNGYQHYEVSAFCQHNKQSQHNLNYWTFGDYLGIGAGAHGKITRIDDSNIYTISRTQKTRLPKDYLQYQDKQLSSPKYDLKPVTKADLTLEFMMNILRLNQGVDAVLFAERTGLSLDGIQKTLSVLKQRQLLVDNPDKIVTSPLGQRFLNDILECFKN